MKIVFFGSTNLGLPVLEALRKQHEIVGVVTTPDAPSGRKQELEQTPVSALANDLKLPLFKPEILKNNRDFISQLEKLNADLFVVVAYGKILSADIINLSKYKTINIHPSALPKYRGPSPIRTALLNGDEYTGVSFIVLDEQVDHGPVFSQQIVKIDPDDNDFSLTDKLGKAAAGNINQAIEDYTAQRATPLPQDDSAATFTKIITRDDGKIDWNKSAGQIYNQYRAFYPWPGVWTTWNGKNLKITDCKTTELRKNYGSTDNYKTGTVLEGGIVACGNGTFLQIKTLQLEGKKETDIKSFLNGYPDFIGSQLK